MVPKIHCVHLAGFREALSRDAIRIAQVDVEGAELRGKRTRACERKIRGYPEMKRA
jgi:hypothetical protein